MRKYAKRWLIAWTFAMTAALSAACASPAEQVAEPPKTDSVAGLPGSGIAAEPPGADNAAGLPDPGIDAEPPGAANVAGLPGPGIDAEPSGPAIDSGPQEDPMIAAGPHGPVIAEIPERDIALHEAAEGVVLRIGEHERFFDWVALTPRMIMPVLHAADFDADGEDELAVILYTGSGTGISIQELHVVDYDGTGRMEDHVFAENDYVGQLHERFEFRPPNPGRDGAATGEIAVDSRTIPVNLAEFVSEEYGPISDRPVFGNIVHFEAEERRLKAQFGVGIVVEPFFTPQYIGTLNADVQYRDGRFVLADMTFEPEPGYRIP
jgi:hypothetical protein